MITQALASNGAKVYITGRREEALQKVVELYSTGSGKIIALPGDISQKDDVKRLANEVASKESKGIHLLVNNGMSAQLRALDCLQNRRKTCSSASRPITSQNSHCSCCISLPDLILSFCLES